MQTNRFRPSKEGQRGPGVYFWQDPEKEKLAKWWANHSRKTKKLSNKKTAIVFANIKVEEKFYVDLATADAKRMYVKIKGKLLEAGMSFRNESELISKCWTELLRTLEQQAERDFKVFQSEVRPPDKNQDFWDFIGVGSPFAVICLDTDIIELKRYECC